MFKYYLYLNFPSLYEKYGKPIIRAEDSIRFFELMDALIKKEVCIWLNIPEEDLEYVCGEGTVKDIKICYENISPLIKAKVKDKREMLEQIIRNLVLTFLIRAEIRKEALLEESKKRNIEFWEFKFDFEDLAYLFGHIKNEEKKEDMLYGWSNPPKLIGIGHVKRRIKRKK